MFLKEFFEKVNLEKSQQMTTKAGKIIQHAKSYSDFEILELLADENEAIAHINKFGSSHTDAIVTENSE